MKRCIVTLLASLLIGPTAVGAAGDAGTESQFSFGAGARELALGGADIAGVTPSYAVYWNPAALTNAERYSLSGFHTRLFEAGMNYQFLGFVAPTMDFGTFGVGAILGTIELFRERNGDIVLCNVSSSIQRILKVLDVGEYLTVKDTLESAREYCMTKSHIG